MSVCTFRLIACILLSGFAGLSAVTALAQEELFNYRQMRSSMPADTGPATVAESDDPALVEEHEVLVNLSGLKDSYRSAIDLQLPDGSRYSIEPTENLTPPSDFI